jgi:glycosyltransferase involved in cell wall biosynthesis
MAAPMLAGGPHYYTLSPESDVGGEVYERELLRRLPEHDVELRLGLPGDHLVASTPPGWTIDVLPYRRGLHWVRAPLVYTPYALGLVRRRQVDVLRGHSVRHTGPSLLLARALTRSAVPVVLHHHHLDPRWARLEAEIARRADAVITVSIHSRDALVRAGVPSAGIHVVPEGVERPPRTQGLPDLWPGGLRLLYLGRLEARKRPQMAIDALERLPGTVEASLVLAGDGPLASELAARSARLGERVRFTGRVPSEQKWALYDSADLVLFPSTLEGFGLVVAEAQSRGVPVIAARGTATVEALDPGRSGLLVEPTAAGFAERFDWDRCAAEVAAIYHALTQSRWS